MALPHSFYICSLEEDIFVFLAYLNITSQQPEHLLDDADSAEKKLGVERAQRGSFLFQSLLTCNAVLAFGSDWPVSILLFIFNSLFFIVIPLTF